MASVSRLSVLVFSLLATAALAQLPPHRPGVLMVKTASQSATLCDQEQYESLVRWGMIASKPVFQRGTASRSMPASELSRWHELQFPVQSNLAKLLPKVRALGCFSEVELALVMQTTFVPNDDSLSQQWHLAVVKAFEGWDLETGGDVSVGITDTGCDLDHPDLVDAIDYNEDELPDGIDNDGNGFVDDYTGWNFYDGNNTPQEVSWSHGTHVGGLVGATVNNALGVAGTGFHTKIIPVKCGNQGEVTHGYEAIEYAVSRGARVVNCSWGSTYQSAFGADVVEAAVENGVLLVCGAGNNNNELDFYPASYPGVLSIAATDSDTVKAEFSSYNYHVDLCAPGAAIYSTKNNGYGVESGTSMSSPIVAGAAALVMSRWPWMTAAQVAAQLVTTAAPVPGIDSQPLYDGKMGSGQLDIQAALTTPAPFAVELLSSQVTDEDGAVAIGESVSLSVSLRNLFGTLTNVELQLEPLSPSVDMTAYTWKISSWSGDGLGKDYSATWRFTVNESATANEEVHFKVMLESDQWQQEFVVQAIVNQDFVNLIKAPLHTTIGANSHVGFLRTDFSEGLGLFYVPAQQQLLYEAGPMVSIPTFWGPRVADCMRSAAGRDRDFSTWVPPIKLSDELATSQFTDTSAVADHIGLRVRQKAEALAESDFVKITYTATNTNANTLEDIRLAFFADFDLVDGDKNFGAADALRQWAATRYEADGQELYAAVQCLSTEAPVNSHFIAVGSTSLGSIDISGNDFVSDEKYQAITTPQTEAGSLADWCQVVSCGPFILPAGDSVSVAFVLHAATSIEDLQANADLAFEAENGFSPLERIEEYLTIERVLPNPADQVWEVHVMSAQTTEGRVSLSSTAGAMMHTEEYTFMAGLNSVKGNAAALPNGVYTLSIQSASGEAHAKLVVAHP